MTALSATAHRSPVDRLPAEVTTYVGRDTEIREVKRLLGAASIVTLTGPGGVGKTRLALRVAATVGTTFRDGILYVPLAELRDENLLVNTIANQLALGDRSARPTTDVIVDALRSKRMLLVLDNCEHLVAACARLTCTLVTACPHLVVLATSRQSLGVAGERVLPVPPLAVPAQGERPQTLERYDAVRLFIDRATAVVPSFEITPDNVDDVISLCRRLDGLPLAIELAAVRLRALSVRQLAERLDTQFMLLTGNNRTAPSRHETLRALIDWSYDLCTEPERLLWERASVFSGSFDLDAAEQVCSGDGLASAEVLDVIDGLLDKSILLRDERDGEVRYRMLEMMRQYGEDRLRKAGAQLRFKRQHRDYYLALSERFEADWIGPNQVYWIDRFRGENANLRVALDFCATDPTEAVVGLRMVFAFKEYWIICGICEGRIWLTKLIDTAPADAAGRAHALWIYAFFALVQNDLTAYEDALAKASEVAERTDDDRARAYVHHVRAYAALIGNDMPTAVELFRMAGRMFLEQGDVSAELWSSFNYGLALGLAGDLDGGRRVLNDCVDTFAARGEVFWRSWALWSRSAVEYLRGDIDAAREAGLEVLRMQQRVDDQVIIAFALTVMAGCATHRDEPVRAARLLGAATTVWHTLGASPTHYGAFVDPLHQDTERVTGELGIERAGKEFTIGAALPTDAAISYALGEEPTEQADPRTPLTKREAEIAELVAKGMTNRQIASTLVIAQRTAETHVEHILTKLGFTNRAQIAAWVVGERQS
ncbi:LuxR C-terminal-related transcriptional regulator [Haloechinothrix salitolerans]|uniref:LuxR C-terminal-related transcriptional regulator n=1 Tax=Haloechinothrix salitolerans TaxID=926830 RepID=A0ABW2BWI4_9PSEU